MTKLARPPQRDHVARTAARAHLGRQLAALWRGTVLTQEGIAALAGFPAHGIAGRDHAPGPCARGSGCWPGTGDESR
jgi:hypothetical protein